MRRDYRFGAVLIHDIRCSNSCVFCKAGDKDLPADLTRAAQRKLHADTMGVLAQGLRNLNLSGNEPLAYSKIAAYLRWIRPRFERITLLDPGNRLADATFAREIASTGVDTFVIPLYGGTAPVHDRCVRNPGAFEAVTAGIRHLGEAIGDGQRIEITTIVLAQNVGTLGELARFVRDDLDMPGIVVNSPMATSDQVGGFLHEFNVTFGQLRGAVSELASEPRLDLQLRYIPPCIFTSRDLRGFARRGRLTLFNVHFDYRFADSERNRAQLEYSRRYRRQVRHDGCPACALFTDGSCGGILEIHADANPGFGYHPLTERLRRELGSLVRRMTVNV